MKIRFYNPNTDYTQIEELYKKPDTFGGQFDSARDSNEKLSELSKNKPNCILVAEEDSKIIGTVTLFEDGRSAWLYRFAIQKKNELDIASELWNKTKKIMKEMGHSQILVYAPKGDERFQKRYTSLGFTKGNDFTAYWQDLD